MALFTEIYQKWINWLPMRWGQRAKLKCCLLVFAKLTSKPCCLLAPEAIALLSGLRGKGKADLSSFFNFGVKISKKLGHVAKNNSCLMKRWKTRILSYWLYCCASSPPRMLWGSALLFLMNIRMMWFSKWLDFCPRLLREKRKIKERKNWNLHSSINQDFLHGTFRFVPKHAKLRLNQISLR